MKINCKWNSDLKFESTIDSFTIPMDAKPTEGQTPSGPTPKQLVLAGVCGCTGMDVAAILKKMRQPLESFTIEADATQTQGHPVVFDQITLIFKLNGSGLLPEKALEAVRLSQTKYCGVSAMICKTAEIHYEVWVNSHQVGSGKAAF